MATARAAVLLAAAAHGTWEHRHAAQIRIQHSMQPCASSPSATPAMPSTMLHHVDIEFVTSTNWAPVKTVSAATGQPRVGWTHRDFASGTATAEAEVPQWTRNRGVHSLLSVFWSSSFAYAVEDPTLYTH